MIQIADYKASALTPASELIDAISVIEGSDVNLTSFMDAVNVIKSREQQPVQGISYGVLSFPNGNKFKTFSRIPSPSVSNTPITGDLKTIIDFLDSLNNGKSYLFDTSGKLTTDPESAYTEVRLETYPVTEVSSATQHVVTRVGLSEGVLKDADVFTIRAITSTDPKKIPNSYTPMTNPNLGSTAGMYSPTYYSTPQYFYVTVTPKFGSKTFEPVARAIQERVNSYYVSR